jgi:hypothetical protein
LEALKRRISDRGPKPENLAALRRYYGDQPTEHAALAMCELIPVVEKQSGQDQKAPTTDEKELRNLFSRRFRLKSNYKRIGTGSPRESTQSSPRRMFRNRCLQR